MKYVLMFLFKGLAFIIFNIGHMIWEFKTVKWSDIEFGHGDEY